MREPIPVPAAEVQRHFARYQDQALTRPITVTSRGRPRIVMLSVEEYDRLSRRDREVIFVEDLPDDLIEAIANAEPAPEAHLYNHELD